MYVYMYKLTQIHDIFNTIFNIHIYVCMRDGMNDIMYPYAGLCQTGTHSAKSRALNLTKSRRAPGRPQDLPEVNLDGGLKINKFKVPRSPESGKSSPPAPVTVMYTPTQVQCIHVVRLYTRR